MPDSKTSPLNKISNSFSFARLPQASLFLAEFSQGLGFLQHRQDLSAQKTFILAEMFAVAACLAARESFTTDLTLQFVDSDFSALVKAKKDTFKGFIKSAQAPSEHCYLIISQKTRTSTLDCSEGIINGFKNYLRQTENSNAVLEIFCHFNKNNALTSFRLLYANFTQKDALPITYPKDYEMLLIELCLKKHLKIEKNISLAFSCDCSREKAKNTLLILGKNTLNSLFANDSLLKIHCDFCNTDYCFTREELLSTIK